MGILVDLKKRYRLKRKEKRKQKEEEIILVN